MIAHEQPVAHLRAIAINRKRLARERVRNHERNQLFWKVQRPVIVAAVGDQRGQPVGVVPGANQVVAGRFGRGVRRVGRVRRLFMEGRVVRRERAVDLVSGNMQEAEFCLVGQRLIVCARGLQQSKRAVDVGLQKCFRARDRAVHMRLRGEVHDRRRLVLFKQRRDQSGVVDIAVHEGVRGVLLHGRQVFRVAGVGQLVQIDDVERSLLQRFKHKVGADKTGAASNENGLRVGFVHEFLLFRGHGCNGAVDSLAARLRVRLRVWLLPR